MIKENGRFITQVYVITLLVTLLTTALLGIFTPSYKLLIFTSLAIFLIIGLLLNNKGYTRISSHFYLWSCFFSVVIYSCSTGGIIAPGLIWLAICPLIGGIIFGNRSARNWLIASITVMVFLVVFEQLIVFDSFNGGAFWYLISFATFFITLVKLLLSLRKTINQHAFELQLKNNQLSSSQLDISKQHQIIKEQLEAIQSQNDIINIRNTKLEQYFDLVMDIGRMDEIHSGNFQFSLNRLSETLLKVLNAQRIKFWEHNKKLDCLKVIHSSDPAPQACTYENEQIRKFSEYWYGQQLIAGVALVINDPKSSKSFAGLGEIKSDSYSFSNILCCPYFIDGEFKGVISCESITMNHFGMEEKLLVRAFADGLSLSYRSKERYDQSLLLKQKQKYIEELNMGLEEKIRERTELIREKNKKLERFVFVNSHEIRGPVCRLQGLKNLISHIKTKEELLIIKEHLSSSVDELDEITRNSNRLLEDDTMIL